VSLLPSPSRKVPGPPDYPRCEFCGMVCWMRGSCAERARREERDLSDKLLKKIETICVGRDCCVPDHVFIRELGTALRLRDLRAERYEQALRWIADAQTPPHLQGLQQRAKDALEGK